MEGRMVGNEAQSGSGPKSAAQYLVSLPLPPSLSSGEGGRKGGWIEGREGREGGWREGRESSPSPSHSPPLSPQASAHAKMDRILEICLV